MDDKEQVEHFDDNSCYTESSDEEVATTLDIIKNRGKIKELLNDKDAKRTLKANEQLHF